MGLSRDLCRRLNLGCIRRTLTTPGQPGNPAVHSEYADNGTNATADSAGDIAVRKGDEAHT
jgi:hypothetical protein